MSVETGWIAPEHWQNPIKSGTLRKRGGKGHISKKWQDRYFRLKNDSLFWFKDSSSETLRGHVPLKGCTIETDTPKTLKYENCFRLYSKKLDKTFYLAGSDYAESMKWVQAIKEASGSTVATKNYVPAVTAKAPGDGEHSLLHNEEGAEDTHAASTRMESLTMTATLLDGERTATTLPGSERSTLVHDLVDEDDDSSGDDESD